MDNIERKIKNALLEDIKLPSSYQYIVRNTLKNSKYSNSNKNSIIKILTTACASILITTGIVYAGTAIYNHIWKEPEKIIGIYGNNEVTNETNEFLIDEKMVINKAKQILEKFGYNDEKIITTKLNKNLDNYDLTWYIETEKGILINFNENNNNYFSISYDKNKILSQNKKEDKITKEEAEQIARKLCKEYEYDIEKYNKIDIQPYSQIDFMKDGKSNQWNITFSKTYEDGINSYENIRMSFIYSTDKIYLYFFAVENYECENNPITITEEEAKEIVLTAEQNINTEYEIINTYTNLDKGLMNGNAYQRLTNYEEYKKQYYGKYFVDVFPNDYVSYRTENKIRNVWVVTIECKGITSSGELSDPYYSYYVDSTTGEIIGGNPLYYMIRLQNK